MSKKDTLNRLVSHSSSRYFAVGVSAFATDYLVLLFTYYVINLPLKVATSLGFFTGFIISFSVNRQWVFAGKQRKHISRQIAEYVALLIYNYFFTVWGVSFLNNHGIKPFIGKLLIMGLIMCWNYALFRWVIFVGEDKDKAEPI